MNNEKQGKNTYNRYFFAQTTFMPLPVIDPQYYSQQLQQKQQRLLQQMAPLQPPPLTVFRSAAQHYRMRAEFRIWHQGERCDYVMFDPEQPKTPIIMQQFPAGSEQINQLMAALRTRLNQQSELRQKLFQAEFLTTLSGQALITLIYHRPLTQQWQQQAETLAADLNCQLIGRSRKQKRVIGNDYVEETLTIDGQPFHYRQIENSFTQPNAGINQQMISWLLEHCPQQPGQDLLELYCGNGNFSLPLAQRFRRVLATEISKASIHAAQYNCQRNNIDNVCFLRLSSEEFTQAWHGSRPFRRLQQAGVELADYQLSTVLVDPPRAGLDPATLALISEFPRILYISCNPHTLAENLAVLLPDYHWQHFALFDQFPYTDHAECGVVLQRR